MLRMASHRRVWCWLAACLLQAPIAFAGTPRTLTDVEARLVIVHNFLSHYVAWPGALSLDKRSDITICSVGHDEVTSQLRLMEKASTHDLKVSVAQGIGASQYPGCHVLYIAENQAANLSHILNQASSYPVLTISPVKQFVELGGMVGLETEIRHQGNFEKHFVRYSLNLPAISRARLSVLPDALELAKRVVRP